MEEFAKKLEEESICVEDFTGNIGVLLGNESSDDNYDLSVDSAMDFLTKVYKIAETCL